MRKTRWRAAAAWAVLDLAIVGVGLVAAIATYVHGVTAQCADLGFVGPIEYMLALLGLALPLAVGLPISVAVSAPRYRRWAWLAAAVCSAGAGAALVLAGSVQGSASRQLIVSLLGNDPCGRYDAYIVDFLAFALVALIGLAYALGSSEDA
jgi:hypothetical protein